MASMVPTDSVQYEVGGSHSTAWHFLTVNTYLRMRQQTSAANPVFTTQHMALRCTVAKVAHCAKQ